LADFKMHNSNPPHDIHNTTDIKWVMKDGTLYDAISLDQVWPKAVLFGPQYRVNDDALQMNTKASAPHDTPKNGVRGIPAPGYCATTYSMHPEGACMRFGFSMMVPAKIQLSQRRDIRRTRR